jgi:DNA-binding NarL/FixJ family response regulator
MPAVAVVTDLIFATKMSSTATTLGARLSIARSIPRLRELLGQSPGIVIVDLDLDGVDAIEAIGVCRAAAAPPRIVAYVSHVRADLVTAARAAGADEVLARSAFVARLPGLLAEAAAGGHNAGDCPKGGPT